MTDRKPPAKQAPAKAPVKGTPRRGRMTPEKPAPEKALPKGRPGRVAVDEDTGAQVLSFDRPNRTAGEKKRSRGAGLASTKTANIVARRADAMSLKRNGATFVQIAEALSKKYNLPTYSNKSAYDDVRESIQRVRTESVHEYVEESVARLDYALMVIASKIAEGDLDAIATMLKIEKRRADLLGLDAARRIQLTGTDGGPIEFALPSIENPQEAYDAALRAVNETLGPPRELPPG